jgi:Uma2 family endonuclease
MPSTEQLDSPRTAIAPKYDNAQQWHDDLGDVPLSRIVFDPWPGTATEEDLLQLVEHDKRLCELIDGTLVEKAMGVEESFVAAAICSIVRTFVKPRKLGSVSVTDATLRLVSSNRIRLPDVAFFSTHRLAESPVPLPKVPRMAPDLAVEVLSEGNTPAEMLQKRKEYFGSGTRLVWIVDLNARSVAVYSAPEVIDQIVYEGEVIGGGNVLPGFSAPVVDFFDDLQAMRPAGATSNPKR